MSRRPWGSFLPGLARAHACGSTFPWGNRLPCVVHESEPPVASFSPIDEFVEPSAACTGGSCMSFSLECRFPRGRWRHPLRSICFCVIHELLRNRGSSSAPAQGSEPQGNRLRLDQMPRKVRMEPRAARWSITGMIRISSHAHKGRMQNRQVRKRWRLWPNWRGVSKIAPAAGVRCRRSECGRAAHGFHGHFQVARGLEHISLYSR